MQNIIRGNRWHGKAGGEIQDSTWSKIIEFVSEVENVQALKDVKLVNAELKMQFFAEQKM